MIRSNSPHSYTGSVGLLLRGLRMVGTGIFLVMLLGIAVIASPVGRVLDRQLTVHFKQMNDRRERHHLTLIDGMECRLLYQGIAIFGQLVSPEGSDIIRHYLDGHGHNLWLNADFIKTSPVIVRSLASLREGESRRFTFRQSACPRLSYAVNPFNLRKKNGKALLWQRIVFKTDPATYTTLNYGAGSFRLPDALIHALHPQPFTVYTQWHISR